MKRAAAALLALMVIFSFLPSAEAFTIIYDGKCEDYPWEPITMEIDGAAVKTNEMPPIVLNGRTLVPAREFFEQLGAEVTWNQSAKRVSVEYGGETIMLTINSRTVYVGGNSVQIASEDPPPKIINDKTMIPVRLVAEEFGFAVEWVNETRTVKISSPEKKSVSLSAVTLTAEKDGDEIFVLMDEYLKPEIFTMKNPDRVVIDIYGAKAAIKDGSITKGGVTISSVRYSQHEDRFRIVADMKAQAEVEVEEYGNGVGIIFTKTGEIEEATETESQPDKALEGRIVVIDAGHGGTDPGAIYPAGSQKPTIREKDVTLAIALKVQKSLEAQGVKVIMTRKGDTYPTLQERVEIANASGADLFVSIHCNSMTDRDEIDGAQVYYFGSSDFGKSFAQIVYDKIIEYTSMTERGIQDGSTLYVIKNTTMPAILTEGGFVSNAGDRKYLLSDEGRSAIARAISEGVCEALKML